MEQKIYDYINKNRVGVVGVAILFSIISVALFGPVIGYVIAMAIPIGFDIVAGVIVWYVTGKNISYGILGGIAAFAIGQLLQSMFGIFDPLYAILEGLGVLAQFFAVLSLIFATAIVVIAIVAALLHRNKNINKK